MDSLLEVPSLSAENCLLYTSILPRIKIREILGYYYSIRSNDYHFDGETHDYFELTYVDLGAMTTVVDGVRYELKERELMIYGPGQFHTQEISSEGPCSYVTIIFDMESSQFEPLLNRVFPYEKKIHTLLKTFILESTSQLPYMNLSLIHIFHIIDRHNPLHKILPPD